MIFDFQLRSLGGAWDDVDVHQISLEVLDSGPNLADNLVPVYATCYRHMFWSKATLVDGYTPVDSSPLRKGETIFVQFRVDADGELEGRASTSSEQEVDSETVCISRSRNGSKSHSNTGSSVRQKGRSVPLPLRL